MNIIHRITLTVDQNIKTTLSKYGFNVQLGCESIDIDEEHAAWVELKPLLREWRALDIERTKFSEPELNKAEYLCLLPDWHWGYPQPEDDFGYLNISYDLSNYSEKSGIGKIQKAPIRIKGEPKWGKKQILQLNWIFDIYFAQPNVWETIFKPFEINSMPVIEHKTNKPCKNILQLMPQATIKLDMADYPNEICTNTGIAKYIFPRRGYFPALKEKCAMNYMVSNEYFGSGHSAFKAVITSFSLYKTIIDNKIRGIHFVPLLSKNA